MTDALADSSAVTPAVTSSTGGTPASSAKRPTPSPAGTAKKRPYRRTKRPKNYCDKSTVTTTTPTLANQPVNVYDAVLGECEDLLQASLEAQRLGRLKMASAYQLLLHTRLVGLGKRFDQASIMPPLRNRKKSTDDETNGVGEENEIEEEEDDNDDEGDEDDEEQDQVAEDGNHRARAARGGGLQMDDGDSVQPTPAVGSTSSKRRNGTSVAPTVKVSNFPTALEKLSEILPSNLEMDTSMMEHLARAAVELHHQRTGRKKSADGLLASPVTGFIGTSPTPTTSAAAVSSTDSKPSSSKRDNTKIAWTPEEQEIVEKAVAEKKAPYAIAKLLKNKTEAQVKAFLKNQAKTSEQTDALAEDLESPSKKRGGRGRKPPTTAMNTVPNANLDAKTLLQGILKRG